MRSASTLLWVLLLCGGLCGPPAAATAWFDEPGFDSLGDAESIPDGVVTTLTQDASGFIWIGTASALVRFDGYRFRRYGHDPATPHSLRGNFIRALLRARDGRLWIGTESDGVAVYEPRSERFRSLPRDDAAPEALAAGSVRALAEGPDGAIWIGTIGGGLHRYQQATRRLQRYDGQAGRPAPRDRRIQAVLVDRDGRLWVGHWRGLERLSADGQRFEAVATEVLAERAVGRLLQAADGRIWVGGQAGDLVLLDPATLAVQHFEPGGQAGAINALTQAADDAIWLGRSKGIEVRGADGRLRHTLRHDPTRASSLGSNEVRALLRDRAGSLWVGSYGGGLQRHHPGNGSLRVRRNDRDGASPFIEPSVTAVMEAADGRLWLGLRETGVVILDAELRAVAGFRPDPARRDALAGGRVGALAQTGDGTVFVGSDSGLYRFDAATAGFIPYRVAASQRSLSVRCLLAGPEGELWVGSEDGVFELPAGATALQRMPTQPGQAVSGAVNALARDGAGRLWIGGAQGLYVRPAGEAAVGSVVARPGQALSHPRVLGLLVDRHDQLWIDTADGLHRLSDWDGRSAAFEAVSARLGIAGRPFGANLLEDGQGRLWTHQHVWDPRGDTVHPLTRADGVDFGTGWFRAYAKRRDGRLLFGGSRGLLIVDPERFAPWHYDPPVQVTELKIDGQHQAFGPWQDGLLLQPGQRSFSVEFAALDFSEPERNRYAYRLAGFDRDWIQAEPNYRVASYGNLAPGHYRLEIRGSNRSGRWSGQQIALPIRVLPAWWQTWWFRSIAGLGAAALVYALIHLRTAWLQRQRRELEAHVRARTADLEAASQALREKSLALEEASLTDPLTGLRNRRFLGEHLAADIAMAIRRHESADPSTAPPLDADIVFFLVDIDHFKQVNDSHGHAAGDALLVQVSERLAQVFRDSDYLVRWGGEEFLILARATSRGFAGELAERARLSIAEQPFQLDAHTCLAKTCSIGFACFPFLPRQPRALDWPAIVDLADAALYAAKRAGRNGWVGLHARERCTTENLAERMTSNLAALVDAGDVAALTNLAAQRVRAALVGGMVGA